MSAEARRVPDVEQERQQLIADLVADYGAERAARYRPGSFGCHELLDRTALLAELLEGQIVNHPSCVQNEDWFELAERAAALIHELYQRVGEAHFAEKHQQGS